MLSQGINSRTDSQGTWSYRLGSSSKTIWSKERFQGLAERMAEVQVECRSAEDALDELSDDADAMIYLDPPYYSAARRYAHNNVDVERLSGLVKRQCGAVAISGYNSEWDHLGWRKVERSTSCNVYGQVGRKRTEVLWMNYPDASDLFADVHHG